MSENGTKQLDPLQEPFEGTLYRSRNPEANALAIGLEQSFRPDLSCTRWRGASNMFFFK